MKDYVVYRLDKAKDTLEVAELLIKNSKWNAAVNRLYYACFYAVNALLAKHNIKVKSHSGVKTNFYLHFIKTGKISDEYGKLFSDLFDWRLKGDYGDFFEFTGSEIIPLIDPVKDFIRVIEQIALDDD